MITTPQPSSKPALPPLLKLDQVGKILSTSRMTVKALIDSGELAAAHVGPEKRKRKLKRVHVRVTRESLAAFYKKRFHRDIHTALQNPAA